MNRALPIAAVLVGLAAVPVAAQGGACAGLDPVLTGSAFVLVVEPAAGARITSGATVVGCSRTFESNVAWRLLAQDGRELASGTARGGGVDGAGEIRFALRYSVERPERGHLELFEPPTTGEGFPPPAMRIPLVLAPGAPDLPLFGRFAGDLPCADCAGIRTELLLYGDFGPVERRFVLVETYVGTPDGERPHEQRGRWEVARSAAEPSILMVIELQPEAGEPRRFAALGGDLELLDREGRRIRSRLDYTLKRQPTTP